MSRCPEFARRNAMTDEEFWEHVGSNLLGPLAFDGPVEPDMDQVSLNATPCIECGEVGACAYDAEGRALIHANTDEDDE